MTYIRTLPVAALLILSLASCRDGTDTPTAPAEILPAPDAQAAAAGITFVQISGGFDLTCGVDAAQRTYCWGGRLGTRPAAVPGAPSFRQISTGGFYTCGLTSEGRAYCWGDNATGQLGDGTKTDRVEPVPVAGGLRFRQISAGILHTCAVTTGNRAYCWGLNYYGELGDGSKTDRLTPVAVAGGHAFKQIAAGETHSCALTTTLKAFCWGSNNDGQLGTDQTRVIRTSPRPVVDGHLFTQISAGWNHTCAVTDAHRAFCWGDGYGGDIGDGKMIDRYSPRAVVGGLAFERITVGYSHTCAETTTNTAYCWGDNGQGQVGDGTNNVFRPTPTAVSGGHRFVQLSAGLLTTCGRTSDGTGYCWGRNLEGQLGDGTTTERDVPTPITVP